MKQTRRTIKDVVGQVKQAEDRLAELHDAMDEVEDDFPNAYDLLKEQRDKIKSDLDNLLNAEFDFIRTPIKDSSRFGTKDENRND